jgi:rod shape-determining protein MreD
MSIDILGRSVVSFIVLIVLQLLVFNNIGISSMEITPAVFVLFILLLPFETPKWIVLLMSFIMGMIIDLFTDSYGLSASSNTLIAFIRPMALQYLSPRGGYDTGSSPRISALGIVWFVKYALILIFFHQVSYYFLDNFGFHNFFHVFTKILIGTVFTFLIILVIQFIFYRK